MSSAFVSIWTMAHILLFGNGLTLYHTILTDNNSKKEAFSHVVFYPFKDNSRHFELHLFCRLQNAFNSDRPKILSLGTELTHMAKNVEYTHLNSINSLPNNKFLDLSSLNAFAGDKKNVTEKNEICVGKCQKAFISRWLKVRIM